MFDDRQSFIRRATLLREWYLEYQTFQGSEKEAHLLAQLQAWAARPDLREATAEAAFDSAFFVNIWGYRLPGHVGEPGYTAHPQFAVAGAGAGGGAGAADLALGWFGESANPIPQVLCEFKDIRSLLDAPQPRKGNTRSPVKQCLDYLAGARRPFIGNEPILPWWGLVTDMNEFRLYWWDRAPQSYARFVLRSATPLLERSLIDPGDDARFDRFVFWKLFQPSQLLSRAGRPALLRLVEKQRGAERALEGRFYQDYRNVRERLFNEMRAANPAFPGTPGRLLRLAQKILDRLIFAFYCEDMGERMLFPPQLLTEQLIGFSKDPFFDPKGDEVWRRFKLLFAGMNTGGAVGQFHVREFNGGLFRHDPEIEALTVPNAVFCTAGQGTNAAAIEQFPNTVLHLCASYNYAARGEAGESVSLYTLGRIFEQSITELEIKEAQLEGRLSLAESAERKVPQRKSQGVYYTPEWVVDEVVEGALGQWLSDKRAELGWIEGVAPTTDQLDEYAARVQAVRVVDPACGSGAFLIGAFRRLLRERLSIHALRRESHPTLPPADERALTAAILSANIYGVDISPPAVEIAKLALWLHSARADAPLSSLDGVVKCGNSLVGPDYYRWTSRTVFSEADREQVNDFSWPERFPFEADAGRFDVVLGNPPYVKLQNLKEVSPDVAAYLSAAREEEFYRSTQTGNFDLYLPFIEKGLRLMRAGGRMGYIAPSLWTNLEYGEALRGLVRETRSLTRWLDFKSHQIFEEATTYTALQFFAAEPAAGVVVTEAPGGEADVADILWDDPDRLLPYAKLPAGEPWIMTTGEDRALIDRLAATCLRLDDPSLTTHIIVGIQTSADSIYHLKRLGDGRYRCTPKDGDKKRNIPDTPPYEVEVEDAVMRPLVSGAEAKRYEEPRTDTWLLFPYAADDADRVRLMPQARMAEDFPKAWAYLSSWEKALRGREKGKMDRDGDWWGYVYPKNLGLQTKTKLLVPRLVTHLKSAVDARGAFFLDNVDVGGVVATRRALAPMLSGCLNGQVADFVFRRLSKPFANDYRSANKQFIAPLPVPDLGVSEQAKLARSARTAQRETTRRRDLLSACAARYAACHPARHPETWLWPGLPRKTDLLDAAPAKLAIPKQRRKWADDALEVARDEQLAALQAYLDRNAAWETRFHDGSVRLTAGGAPAASVFADEAHGPLIVAYWRWLFLRGAPRDAEKLAEALRRPPAEPEVEPARQFIIRVDELAALTQRIAEAEQAMNARLFDLYGLTKDERRLVEAG